MPRVRVKREAATRKRSLFKYMLDEENEYEREDIVKFSFVSNMGDCSL